MHFLWMLCLVIAKKRIREPGRGLPSVLGCASVTVLEGSQYHTYNRPLSKDLSRQHLLEYIIRANQLK